MELKQTLRNVLDISFGSVRGLLGKPYSSPLLLASSNLGKKLAGASKGQ